MEMDIFVCEDDGQMAARVTPEPAKRGRPKGATKPKPAPKPRWKIDHWSAVELIEALRDVAVIIEPTTKGNFCAQLKVVVELLELIENKKVS